MAVTAEAVVSSQFARPGFAPALEVIVGGEMPTLHTAVPAEHSFSPEETPSVEWRDADTISGLRRAREAAREEAAQILQERIDQLCEDPETAAVPNPVDPLTTAARALKVKREFGEDSPEYAEARDSLVQDCKRLFGEAYRKNRWEIFGETKQTFNTATGGYEFMGYSLDTMVRQGVTPMAEKGEQRARTAEYVEEQTYKAVRGLGFLAVGNVAVLRPGQPIASETAKVKGPEVRVLTISECPDWAIDAHARQSKGGWGGYAPETEKIMIRGVRFAHDGNRYQEQVAVPGIHINHKVVVETMRRMQVVGANEELSKDDVRAKQVVNVSGQGALATVELLDTVAGEFSGKLIFLGEEVSEDHPRDYNLAREEAAARQERQEADAQNLANFLMTLEETGADHWVAQGIVGKRVHQVVFAGVKGNREAAAAAFDEKTAEKIEEAQKLREAGNEEGARKVEALAEKEAPAAAYCGSGQCGIEGASIQQTAEACSALGVDANVEVLRDTERPCQNCKTVGEVFYVVDKDSGALIGKYCGNCKATEGGNTTSEETGDTK